MTRITCCFVDPGKQLATVIERRRELRAEKGRREWDIAIKLEGITGKNKRKGSIHIVARAANQVYELVFSIYYMVRDNRKDPHNSQPRTTHTLHSHVHTPFLLCLVAWLARSKPRRKLVASNLVPPVEKPLKNI